METIGFLTPRLLLAKPPAEENNNDIPIHSSIHPTSHLFSGSNAEEKKTIVGWNGDENIQGEGWTLYGPWSVT